MHNLNTTPKRITLHDAWADWLRSFEPYDWYTTLTFKNSLHIDQALKQYSIWIHRLNDYIFGKRYRETGKGIISIRAAEYQKRGVLHFHLLLGNLPYNLHRKSWEQVWEIQHSNNGFANTYPYDQQLGACGYLGKYISKGGELDIFLPPWLLERIKGHQLRFDFMPTYELL